jgi:starch phosphorylase
VFEVLDRTLWKDTLHNPVRLLQLLPKDRLETISEDHNFLARYDTVMTKFKQEMTTSDNWYGNSCPEMASGDIAYFSMEFAVHNSLPIYAGGLGVLSGDYF